MRNYLSEQAPHYIYYKLKLKKSINNKTNLYYLSKILREF